MRLPFIAVLMFAIVITVGCSPDTGTTNTLGNSSGEQLTMDTANNAFFQKSVLQYQAPEFDKIRIGDYEPAFAEGFKQHSAEIAKIANNTSPPSFENTIVAMETSGELLNRVATMLFNLSSLMSNDEYRRIEAEMSPKLSEHTDNIFLNPKLFQRVVAVYDNRATLDSEAKQLAEYYYREFLRAGVKLDQTAKARMREINAEMSTLTTKFSQNILDSFKNDVTIVKEKNALDGLSDDELNLLAAAAQKAGEEGYLITLVNTTRQPILSRLKNRALRQKIWETSANRAMDVNGPIALKLAKLRAEKAHLLDYPNWASYVVDDQMAKTPDAIYEILDGLVPKALARAKEEAADIQALIDDENGNFTVQPWDWFYYTEQVRKTKYDLDEDLVKPYFEFNTVLQDGLFFSMQRLYGITFTTRTDLPLWHDDVLAFEIFDEDGGSIGLFYLDPYAREGKNGGAWMSEWVTQSHLLNNKPVVYNALNIPKPAEGRPTLMTFDEVTTLFHEFGHAVHGLFSNVQYPSLAGTATARDFVEFPSQAHEDWAIDPVVLANYAKHYETGNLIPKALLDKVLQAHKFNQGFDTTEYLAAALLDMEWHSLSVDTQISDMNAFEQQALAKHDIDFLPVPPRYKSAYFSHVFAGGYSAGYYAYLWTEVLAADAFAYMQQNGGLIRANGDAFRDTVLSRGNSRDLMQNFMALRGQKPTIDALLTRRGLDE